MTSRTVSREALVARGPITGASIVPMWISGPTQYSYGVSQNLYMADYSTIPGNFGWLDLPSGITESWNDCLSGVPMSEADLKLLFARPGETFWSGLTGQKVGQWTSDLNSRITRAAGAPWTGETFDQHSPNNPRIMVVPMVTWLGGTGTGARFRIDRFGAFWLDQLKGTGSNKYIYGRFLHYAIPGADMDVLASDNGVNAVRLVR
ncbi:MAG: hypothetical protein WCP21_10760 [Armatimonadota bacterium]